MTKRCRRNHSAAFKVKVALAAIKGNETMAQLATRYDVHPNQIVQWKGQLLERAAGVFNGTGQAAEPGSDINTLHATIGQLALEDDLLAGALGRSPGSSASEAAAAVARVAVLRARGRVRDGPEADAPPG